MMVDTIDEDWFGYTKAFDKPVQKAPFDTIRFPEGKDWRKYIASRRLEITCGEAPFIVSRYDASTGERIPIPERYGILDRKLRVINEQNLTESEWMNWVIFA